VDNYEQKLRPDALSFSLDGGWGVQCAQLNFFSNFWNCSKQVINRGPSKDPRSAHQCTVYILRSQVQVHMSSVELS